MKHFIILSIFLCLLFLSCKHESSYYNPDVIINENSIGHADSVTLNYIKDIPAMVYGLHGIDNYLILVQNNRDNLIQVYDMRNGSLVTCFGTIGHAQNELRRVPVKAYCMRNGKGLPMFCVQEENCTKLIDIKESVEANKCVLSETIKEDKDFSFYYIFHIGDNQCFNYKTVSYEDARDNIYIRPMFYLNDNSEKKWDVFPQIISPANKSLIDCAYLMKVLNSPNGKYVVGINQLVDIVTIFDLSHDKTIGVINPNSYTIGDIETEFNENNQKEKLILYNFSGCATDSSFFILKNGDLYMNAAVNGDENGYSVVNRYDWNGGKLASYVLNKKIMHIAYNEKTRILYAVSVANKLYSCKLR